MTTRLFEGTKRIGGDVAVWNVRLEVHQCGTCGVVFGVETGYMDARREDHLGWKCPNGHSFVFNGESEKERLTRERDAAKRVAQSRLDLLRFEERSHAATKGHLTRQRKRAARAMCPVPGCKRHFANVEAHIERQHPEWLSEHRHG